MNIINIGGWYVGNTAILDWMDGFEELAFIKGDFNITRLEGGIMDMIAEQDVDNKLAYIDIQKKQCYLGAGRALKIFVGRYTKHFLKPKQSPSYLGHFSFHTTLYKFLNRYENLLKRSENFDEIAFWQSWLSTNPSLDSGHKRYKHTVYQNPFFYDETFDGHKDIWPKLFSPYKMIFVHRDPLDQFSDIVNKGDHLLASWPRFHGGTENMHPADRFFTISKKLYTARLRMAESLTKEDLVVFSFEDFLYEHERVTNNLKEFLKIESKRDINNRRFVRDDSIKNIGKGKDNTKAAELLRGKPYIMQELNELRYKLINHPLAI